MTITNTMEWAKEVLFANMEGMTAEEQQTYLEDVVDRGCASGCVSGAIYTNEINELFKANLEDILERLDELNESYGYDGVHELFQENAVSGGDYINFPTFVVWLIIEDTAGVLLASIEDEEE